MVSGKVILAVSRIWGVPAQPGDVPSAYVKADKEEGFEILLHIPQGMEIEAKLLDKFGVQDKGHLALRLKKGLRVGTGQGANRRRRRRRRRRAATF
uniref:RxLR effector candidate protein n=1 Tax=Hyaloperonospora arabidopsidis (strain Emoy2) TaxID=559515 RepID=M4BL36_HYAAE|nr:RxLR effector candidate protein [Hyaloperonospora arabidopsidis Emoy2]